ncbi:hypothetical protein QCA50_003836 [Cerrena zonata]|uniref:C2H2-type domain-containing protein n=1 Tax=Cerrena zonata TaxID=2478898 RepID=A0AAW0GHP4_9APHY
MDPNHPHYYNQGNPSSLSSTTDPSQYTYGQSQPLNPEYQTMYGGGAYPTYGQGHTQPLGPSASYPGTMGQSSMGQRLPARSNSTPNAAGFPSYGQGQPTQYGQYQQSVPQPSYQAPQGQYPPNPAVNYVSSTQYAQGYHSQSHRSPPTSPTTSSSPGTERFPCDRCSKSFTRAHDRKRHFETHHSAQPPTHRCPFCHKEFSRADSLKRHIDNGCDKDPNNAS